MRYGKKATVILACIAAPTYHQEFFSRLTSDSGADPIGLTHSIHLPSAFPTSLGRQKMGPTGEWVLPYMFKVKLLNFC